MAGKKLSEKKSFIGEMIKHKVLFFMIFPAALYFLIFAYLPMVGSVLAFKEYNYADGIFGSPWSGFENFKFLFQGGKIYSVMFNTIAYNTVFLIVNQTFQIAFAILLAEIGTKYFKKITQSVMFLPYFISWVLVGAFISNIFQYEFGSMNTMLTSLGFDRVNFYTNVEAWKYILVAVSGWKWIGYGTIIYLAAIVGIDNELYEAATIDGAGKFNKIMNITLPMILPQIIILTLLNIGNIFKGDFQMFYQVTANNPLLYDSTDVIDTFVVRALLQLQDVGMGSAAGLMQSIICFIILISCNGLVRKYDKDYALF